MAIYDEVIELTPTVNSEANAIGGTFTWMPRHLPPCEAAMAYYEENFSSYPPSAELWEYAQVSVEENLLEPNVIYVDEPDTSYIEDLAGAFNVTWPPYYARPSFPADQDWSPRGIIGEFRQRQGYVDKVVGYLVTNRDNELSFSLSGFKIFIDQTDVGVGSVSRAMSPSGGGEYTATATLNPSLKVSLVLAVPLYATLTGTPIVPVPSIDTAKIVLSSPLAQDLSAYEDVDRYSLCPYIGPEITKGECSIVGGEVFVTHPIETTAFFVCDLVNSTCSINTNDPQVLMSSSSAYSPAVLLPQGAVLNLGSALEYYREVNGIPAIYLVYFENGATPHTLAPPSYGGADRWTGGDITIGDSDALVAYLGHAGNFYPVEDGSSISSSANLLFKFDYGAFPETCSNTPPDGGGSFHLPPRDDNPSPTGPYDLSTPVAISEYRLLYEPATAHQLRADKVASVVDLFVAKMRTALEGAIDKEGGNSRGLPLDMCGFKLQGVRAGQYNTDLLNAGEV